MSVCKTCKEPMVGYGDECSDCAFGLGVVSENAAKAVEESYFQRTGKKKTCGEIFRGILDRASRGYK